MKRASCRDGHHYVPSQQSVVASLLAACIAHVDCDADPYDVSASACLAALALEAAFYATPGSCEADAHLYRADMTLAAHGLGLIVRRRVAYVVFDDGERLSVYADTRTPSGARIKQRALC